MTDTELTDLLRTAARVTGNGVRPDARALVARARRSRRRQRTAGACALGVLLLLGAAALPPLLDDGEGHVEVAAGDDRDGFKPGWTRLPDPPLSPRASAAVVWTGKEIVVAGGTAAECPPSPSCTPPPAGSSFTDGAAFDVTARTWRPIAPAPRPILGQTGSTASGGDAFVLTSCQPPACPGDGALLRYRPAEDVWDVLPPPPGPAESYRLSGPGGSLLAFGLRSNELSAIWRFDLESSSWAELPQDPRLSRLNQAAVLGDGEDVLVFGHERPGAGVDGRPDVVTGARLSGATATWSSLPPAAGARVLPRVLDGLVVLTADRPGTAGGVLDVEAGTWDPLPAVPATASAAGGSGSIKPVVGALGRSTATFDMTQGLVLDTTTRTWLEVPPIDNRTSAESFTSFGRRLFSLSGARGPGAADLLGEAWVWTPPAASAAAAPADPATAPAPPAVEAAAPPSSTVGPPPMPAAAPAPPSAPATPGAPVFVSASGDATARRITVRFDRPVAGDPVDKSPGPKNHPAGKTTPMSLVVFGDDKACSSPQGNGQDYVSGLGTDTVTVEATSMAAGTTYISISSWFVKSAVDGTPNDPVVTRDPPGTFGSSCIPVKVSGAVPTTAPYVDPVGGPQLLSATATAGAGGPPPAPGTGAGRVTLRFDKPVVPGDGPNFDGSSPNLQPAPGDSYMRAMQLVVHQTDSTCSSPNGNAHAYLSGVGTDTLTVDATGLVVGTTYISISPGFAKAATDGKAMGAVGCLAVPVSA